MRTRKENFYVENTISSGNAGILGTASKTDMCKNALFEKGCYSIATASQKARPIASFSNESVWSRFETDAFNDQNMGYLFLYM